MNNSNIISKEIAIKFYKLAKYTGELFSNEFDECNKNGCIIVTQDDFKTLSTGVTTKIYENQNKRISSSNKKIALYTITVVEDAITRAVRLGGISLQDSILIVSCFPCLYSLKMIIQYQLLLQLIIHIIIIHKN
jgi:deoxycytidylate deaminase